MNTARVATPTRSRWLAHSLLIILVISSLLMTLIWQPAFGAPAVSPEQPRTLTPLSPTQLYASLRSSVVRVEGSGGNRIRRSLDGLLPRERGRSFGDAAIMNRLLDTNRSGAGFFMNDAGHILTSHSIIDGTDTIYVTFTDGTWYTAEVTGSDPISGLAVLNIPDLDHDFTPLPFANEAVLEIGDTVFALGYPASLTGTLTQGIVTSLQAQHTGEGDYLLPYLIQSDVANLPSLAGSPLVNAYGEAVGINLNLDQPFTQAQALNLSLPIAMVQQVTPHLIQGVSPTYPRLGVAGDDLSPAQAAAMDLDTLYQGAYIASVGEDSAAARGGIQEGDFVTAVNGVSIHTFSDLAHQLLVHHTGGEAIQLDVLRDGTLMKLTITLDTRTPVMS